MPRLFEVLVHSLWQGGVLAAGLWSVLRVLPARHSQLRYLLAVSVLPMLLLAAALTWSVLGLESKSDIAADVVPAEVVAQVTQKSAPAPVEAASTRPSVVDSGTASGGGSAAMSAGLREHFPGASWVVLAWLVVAGLLVMRTVVGYGTGRTHLTAGARPVEGAVARLADRMGDRLGLRRSVVVLQQARCAVPCVVGVFKPVILLPPAVVMGLTPGQLEVILAHELAHVRRWDAVVDLIQRLFSSVLFFNPGLYWVNRQIRQEREACCDAVAAQVTGDRIAVAQALHAVAQLAQPVTFEAPHTPRLGTPVPALAATGGQLTNRVSRLLRPGGRSRAVLRWPTVLGVLCLSVLGLWLIQRGAQATVVLADEILNPEVYIQETQHFVEEGGAFNEAWLKESYDQSEQAGQENVTVSGTIRSADGSPLGRRVSLSILSQRPTGGAYSLGWSTEPGPTPDVHVFHCDKVRPGMVSIHVNPKRLAPTLVKEQLMRPGAVIDPLDIVLEPGFEMKLQLIDHQGKPIPDAAIESASLCWAHGQSSSVTPNQEDAHADEQGWVTLKRLSNDSVTDLKVTVDAPGFERTSAQTPPKADGVWRIKLAPAKPVTGLVLDADTQRPIPGAQVHVISRRGGIDYDPRANYYKEDPLTTTDEAGRFELDGFRGREQASLWIQSPGKMSHVIWDVNGGDDLRISMPPAIVLRVELSGPIDGLKKNRQGQAVVSLSQSAKMKKNSLHDRSFDAVVKTDEQGRHIAVFDGHLLPGRAEVYAGESVSKIETLESTETVQIDLSVGKEKPAQRDSREVVIAFIPPKGWPAPTGTISVTGYFEADDRYHGTRTISIEGGRASFKVLMNPEHESDRPTQIGVGRLDTPGYWLPKRKYDQKTRTDGLVLAENPQEPEVFRLKVLPAGVIRGHVVDEDGKSLANADLSLKTIAEPKAVFGDNQTDSNWWNNINADHAGRFVISPVPFGGTYMPQASSGALSRRYDVGWGKPVTPSAQQPHAEVTIVVPRGQDAAVTVLDPDGKPVTNAELDLSRRSPGGSNGWSPNEFTDGQGRFVFRHLNLDPPGVDGVVHTVKVLPNGPYKGVSYEIDPNNLDRVIRLERGKTLTGVLLDDATGKPLPHVKVSVQPVYDYRSKAVGFSDPVHAKTDEQGRFVLQGLEDAKQRVRVDRYLMTGSTINRDPATGRTTSISSADWPVAEPSDEPTGADQEPALKMRVIKSPWG